MTRTNDQAQDRVGQASCRCGCGLHPPATSVRETESDVRRADGGRVPRHARRGAVLLLVICFIFLAGALAVLATTHSVQLARTTRQHDRSIVLRQMADSAYGWLAAQSDWRTALPTSLDIAGAAPDGTTGTVQLRIDEARPDVVIIEAQLNSMRRPQQHTTSFKLPS